VNDLSEIQAVWRGEVNRAFRSGRLATLLVLFLLVTGVAMGAVAGIVRLMTQQADESLAQAIANGVDPTEAKKAVFEQKKKVLSFFTNDEKFVDAVAELPVALLATFKVLTWFLPFFVVLMGFDQLAGEVGPKSIRFLVVRLRRRSILLGKWASQVSLLTLMLLVTTLATVGVTKVLNAEFAWAAAAVWAGKLFLALVAIGVTWSALSALFSAIFRTPAVSLVINIIAVLLFAAMANLGAFFRFPHEEAKGLFDQLARDESLLAYLRYSSVWTFGQSLIHPNWRDVASSALMHLGWALGFVGVAATTLEHRDL
jgi:ABC-2 type transport system permease protein